MKGLILSSMAADRLEDSVRGFRQFVESERSEPRSSTLRVVLDFATSAVGICMGIAGLVALSHLLNR